MQATPTTSTHAGLDWSWHHHAVCVVDGDGGRIEEATVPHSRSGLDEIAALLREHAVARVGIERGDGPVVHRNHGHHPHSEPSWLRRRVVV